MTEIVLLAVAVLLWPGLPGGVDRADAPVSTAPAASASSRVDQTVEDVADAIVLLSVAFRAPVGIPEALERVAAVSRSTVRRDLTRVAAAHRWGVHGAAAWSYAGPAWAPAARALHVADVAGAAPADLLAAAAGRIRDDETRRVEVAVGRAGALLVLPLGLFMLPAFVCTAIVPVVIELGRALVP